MARYGLPDTVEFCTRCVQSNQKVTPSVVQNDTREGKKHTLIFKDGVCSACLVHEAKESKIDWAHREEELLKLLEKYRSNNGSYDCIVPGSGGKDSVFQSHILKTKYGMTPLTVTWAPHEYTEVGKRNFDRWIKYGCCDNFLFTPNGEKHSLLTKLAFENLLHPFQPFIFGQRNFVMHMSIKFGIKLIFFGESPAEYGGMKDEELSSQMLPMYFIDDAREKMLISGLSLKELEEKHSISENDLQLYLPLTTEEFRKHRPDPRFLGHFLKFHPQANYYYAKDAVGFEPNDQRTEGSYSRYNSIDDKIDGYHYWCSLIKFGVGRTTHEASQEIRNGDLTREEGVALVHKYDSEFPKRYFNDFLEYMNLNEDHFFNIANSFRSEHLWKKINGNWVLKYQLK